MPITTVTSGPFKVRTWSGGAGPALVYLHGIEGHPGDAPFLHELAKKHRVIAPEFPGYGESTGFDHIDGVLAVALHLRRLLKELGVESADVVGHSLGGMFAAEFAAICPQVTRRLVLVDAYGLWIDDLPLPDLFTKSEADLKKARWANPDAPGAVEPSIFAPDETVPGSAMMERMKNLSIATKFMWPIPDRGLRSRLEYIEAPTLIVHGASDGLVPAVYAHEFQRLIPGSKVAMIDGAGHLPMVEQSAAFSAAVEGFLA